MMDVLINVRLNKIGVVNNNKQIPWVFVKN